MNPIIKFTTLFGLLAVDMAMQLGRETSAILAVIFFVIMLVFVWRSSTPCAFTPAVRRSPTSRPRSPSPRSEPVRVLTRRAGSAQAGPVVLLSAGRLPRDGCCWSARRGGGASGCEGVSRRVSLQG